MEPNNAAPHQDGREVRSLGRGRSEKGYWLCAGQGWRRARLSLRSLIPTTTGSASAITLTYPELKGRLSGHAIRVPMLNASLTDCVFEVARTTTVEEVNALFATAAEGVRKGILGHETRPLASCDFTNNRRSAIVNNPSTLAIDGRQVKIFAWDDNDRGYARRLADVARRVASIP